MAIRDAVNIAPTTVRTWGCDDPDDAENNTLGIRAKIQELVREDALDVDGGGLPMLRIHAPFKGTIKVRPNISAPLPDEVTSKRFQGLTLVGAGRRKTLLEVTPEDASPSEQFYGWNATEWTDNGAATYSGAYARVTFDNMGFVPVGGGPSTNYQNLYPCTAEDDGSQPLWEKFTAIRLRMWAKEFTFRDCYFGGCRYVLDAGESDQVGNGDVTLFDNCTFNSVGTLLRTQHIQCMAWHYFNCKFELIRRNGFEFGSGGGGDLLVIGHFYAPDHNLPFPSFATIPYMPRYWIIYTAPDCASGLGNGGYRYSCKTELRGPYGIWSSRPTPSDQTQDDETLAAAIANETRERGALFYDCTMATMQNILGAGKGRSRYLTMIGPSQKLLFKNVQLPPYNAGQCRYTNRDMPVFGMEYDDRLTASGGSYASGSMAYPPWMVFEDTWGPRNLLANHIEFRRPDGGGMVGMGDVDIIRHVPTELSPRATEPSVFDRWCEDGSWRLHGTFTSRPIAVQVAEISNGRNQIPGDNPTFLTKLNLPPCELLGVTTEVAADAAGGTGSCGWGAYDQDGVGHGVTTAGSATGAQYANDVGLAAPKIFSGPKRSLQIRPHTVVGTVSTRARRHRVLAHYRGWSPSFSDGGMGRPDPCRDGLPFSRDWQDHAAHVWPMDEGGDPLIVAAFSDSLRDYGFAFERKHLAPRTTVPARVSDGTLGRYVRAFDGSADEFKVADDGIPLLRFSHLNTATPAVVVDNELCIWLVAYFANQSKAYANIASFYDSTGDGLLIGAKTSVSPTLLQVFKKVNGVQTLILQANAAVDTWHRIVFRSNASGCELLLADGAAADTDGPLGFTAASTVDEVHFGANNGGQTLQGRLGGCVFCSDHYARAEDVTVFYGSHFAFPRIG